MDRYNKYLAILIALIMFVTTFTMANPVRVNAETAETTVVEAAVTGGVIKFDTSTGTVTGLSSIEDAGTLVIPDTIEGVTVKAIGQQAFNNNDTLVSIELPDSVELIDQHAFNNCAVLETVKMPANLMKIESYAFSFCYKLKDIELPEGLKYIYGGAFNECTSITNVHLPASLIDFVKPFLKCTSLAKITVDSDNANFYTIDGVLFDNDGLVYYPAGKPGSEYTVPDNEKIKYIESSAFSGAVNLTSIHVPGNITEMKSYAIDSCGALKTVTFDEGLLSLDITAIHNSSIETITFPDSLQSIYKNSLYACRSLREVNIGAGLTTINYSGTMFTACTVLEKINVDQDNTNYSSEDGVLFDKNQTKLIAYPIYHEGTHYVVPESVTEIGEYAFSSVTRLLTLQIPDSVTTIGDKILKSSANTVGIYCNTGSTAESYANENGYPLLNAVVEAAVIGGVIKFDTTTGTVTECVSLDGSGTLEIPETIESVTVKAIGDSVFSKTQSLTKVILPDTIESIGDEAFLSCYHLEKINMPANLKSIGYMAFYDNDALSAITFSGPLETIGEEAFAKSAVSGDLYIPATVTSIGDAAFAECTGITSIIVADENTIYRSDSGVLFNADTLVMYPAGKNAAEYVMPVLEGIKYIESGAFKGAATLTKITIAEGVTSIQDEAFYGCKSLAIVEFPSTLNILRSKSFGATALTSVTLPDATTRMWSDAFAGCTQLTEVNIPAKAIIYWSNSILSGCTSLTKINIDEDNTTYMSDDGVVFSKDETVLWKYPQNHAGTTYTVPATVKEIHEQAFDGCVNLQEIILQSGLQKIETMAFNNCDSLQSVTVPEGVTEIAGYAFSSCDSLKVVTIPSSVTTIGSQMLYNMSQQVVIVCDEGSAAAEYAASNSVPYSYDGKTIVGTGEEFENPDPVEPTQSEQEIVCDETVSKVFGCEDFSLGATAQTALTYKSGNTKVAEVDADGNVTVKAAGVAVITITAAETDEYLAAEKNVTINVSKADQSISGDTEFSKVYGDAEFNLNQTAKTSLTYKSDNTAVADVDENGLITIKGAGTANITVTAADGNNYNSVEKTVVIKVAKSGQSIVCDTAISKPYGSEAFNIGASAKTTLYYKSNNTNVADVDKDGTVTIKNAGKAVITITAADSADYNAAEVKVTITVSKVDQSIECEEEFVINEGSRTFNLNASAKTAMSYESNNTAVADVDDEGNVIVNGPGTAVITINAEEGVNYNSAKKAVTVIVNKVEEPDDPVVEPDEPTVEPEIPTEPQEKQDQIITGTSSYVRVYQYKGFFYLDADSKTSRTYQSSNTSVVTVAADGKVSIKGAGRATITVIAGESDQYKAASKTITVTINKATQKITCNKTFNKTFKYNGYFFLKAKSPTKKIYKSSNKKIATVSATGKVTMKNPGKVTITITAQEGKNYTKVVKKVTVTSKMKKPVLTVNAQKGKKNKLSWTKVPGAHGYKVYIYDKSKGKYVCRVTKKATVKSVTHKGLKAGKTYKYKVRAYRVVGGKMVYSPYSKVKSVKAKK